MTDKTVQKSYRLIVILDGYRVKMREKTRLQMGQLSRKGWWVQVETPVSEQYRTRFLGFGFRENVNQKRLLIGRNGQRRWSRPWALDLGMANQILLIIKKYNAFIIQFFWQKGTKEKKIFKFKLTLKNLREGFKTKNIGGGGGGKLQKFRTYQESSFFQSIKHSITLLH